MKIVCQSCGKKYDTEKDELCPKCGSYNPFDGRASTQSRENKEEKQSRNCNDDSSWEKRERMKEELIRIAEEAKKKSEDSDLYQTEDSFSKQNQPMPEKKKSGSCLGFLFGWMVLICIVLTAVTWISRGAAEITYRALKQEFQKMEQETVELNGSFWLDDGSKFVVKIFKRNGWYWVRTPTVSTPELMQLLSGKSMILYLPPNDTAGFATFCVKTPRRLPCPPANSIAIISFLTTISPLAVSFCPSLG